MGPLNGSPNRRSYGVRLSMRGPERFAENGTIPWDQALHF